jgi:hypothetical protein
MSVRNKIEGFSGAIQLGAEPRRGRPTKFTPERIREITTLIERGKSRQEIAQIIGVTTGTLQVTCSKLGISLRRPRSHGTHSDQPLPQPADAIALPSHAHSEDARQKVGNGQHGPVVESASFKDAAPHFDGRIESSAPVNFAVRVEYRGEARIRQLPLTQDMIGRLAIEAEFLGIRTDELIGRLIVAIVEKDMVKAVLDRPPLRAGPAVSD